jgi:hypothetical protein
MSRSEADALLSEPDFSDSHDDPTPTDILTKRLDVLINQTSRPLMNAPRVNLLEGLRVPALSAFDQGDDLEEVVSPVTGDGALSEGEVAPTLEPTHVGRYLPPMEPMGPVYGHHRHDDDDDGSNSDESTSSSSHSTFERQEVEDEPSQSQIYMQALMEQAVRTGDTEYTFDGIKGFISKGIDKLKKPLRSKEEKLNDKEVKLNAAAAASRTRAEQAVAKAKKAAAAAAALKTPSTKMDMPATETFDAAKDRREKLRMKAIQDGHEKSTSGFKSPLNWTEARFASLIIDAVSKGPSESLAQLDDTFADRNARRESKDHYLGALAAAVTFGAIRSAIEKYHGIDGTALKTLTDQHDSFASQGAPMDPAKIALFADAASEYSNMVRSEIEKKTKDHSEQERLAIDKGTRFAAAVLERMESKFNPAGTGGAWAQPLSASHPSVALTSTTQRLSSLYLKNTVDHDFATAKHAAFWSQPLTSDSWTATTVGHFA